MRIKTYSSLGSVKFHYSTIFHRILTDNLNDFSSVSESRQRLLYNLSNAKLIAFSDYLSDCLLFIELDSVEQLTYFHHSLEEVFAEADNFVLSCKSTPYTVFDFVSKTVDELFDCISLSN